MGEKVSVNLPCRMSKEKGLILTITIIFVLIIIIMAGVALLLMTNHARITENQIRRIEAIYVAESAALTMAYEELRTGTCNSSLPFTTVCPRPLGLGNFNATINGLNVVVTSVTRGSDPSCPGSPTTPPEYCIRANVIY